MNSIDTHLLREIADLERVPQGAYNIRKNGQLEGRSNSANIVIESKEDKPGIDIHIAPGTVNESMHIPVIVTQTGLTDLVYNDFHIGENSDVSIVAGCGIHNSGCETAQHDGVHTFYVGKNAKVRYVEKHYGEGEGTGKRILNPHTIIYLEEGASIQLETVQIRGVDSTRRYTKVEMEANAEAVVTERLLTHGDQFAESKMEVIMKGEGARTQVISRSVAQDNSVQVFYPQVQGDAPCFGHVQCDSIIMDHAKVSSIPAIVAGHTDAQLIHEAAIGKIAGDQLLKLMTLGLTEEEAEQKILDGFLR